MKKLMENPKSFAALLFSIFVCGGVYGFIYETIFYYLNDGAIFRRGSAFGPWIQIYAIGSVMILFLCYDLRKNCLLVALVSGLSAGVLEYIAGYLMFHFGNGFRSWDYNVEKWNWGNIDGFVCFRSVAVFAVSGLILVYVLVPLYKWAEKRIGLELLFTISLILFTIAALDIIYNDILVKFLPLTDAITFYEKLGWPSRKFS